MNAKVEPDLNKNTSTAEWIDLSEKKPEHNQWILVKLHNPPNCSYNPPPCDVVRWDSAREDAYRDDMLTWSKWMPAPV